MKVVLPDSSELELPDGATGLDAAAAIGPKLAEQAVLVRSNGQVQDLRLPLAGRAADPDPDDPRHGRSRRAVRPAPLGRAPPRRGRPAPLPGNEDRDRPADRERLLLRLRVPGADRRGRAREDRGGDPARAEGGPRLGAPGDLADEAKKLFAEQGEDYKVELVDTAEGDISLYTQGDFTDLCRGPHLQDSKPIKAIKLTGLAGAYWRGDEHNKQLTRIYGTAFFSQADLDAYLERLEEAKRRDHRRLGSSSTSSTSPSARPGSPLWHPKGMVIWDELEKIRRRENAKRGYLEVKTPLLYDEETFLTSGHFREVRGPHVPARGRGARWAMKAMNCPGTCCSSGASCAPTASSRSATPSRRRSTATSCTGTLHGLLRVQHVTQDDAHIFCTPEQIQDEIAGAVDFARYLYDLFGHEGALELSTRPDNKLGTDEEWDLDRGRARGGPRS